MIFMRIIALVLTLAVLALPVEARRRWTPKAASGNVPTTVGYNSVGALTDPLNGGVIINSGPFVAPFSGTITVVEVYGVNITAGLTAYVGIYTDSAGAPNAPVGTYSTFASAGTWVLGWKSFTLSSPLSVTSGSSYWITFEVDTSTSVTNNYDTGFTNGAYYKNGHTPGAAWPNPFSATGSLNVKYSFRATLTP